MSTDRLLKFSQALDEATMQAMEANPRVFLMGLGIDDPKGAFGTTLSAFKKYGTSRVHDMPMAESAMTGVGVGAALNGCFPIMIHMRIEFLLLGIDQLVNHAAKWKYMFGGGRSAPMLIRCIVGRGWGQAAQHSQSLHSLFGHLPGVKVVLPSNAYDAKGLLLSAVQNPGPVVMVEHRWLYDRATHVPEAPYTVPFGQANVAREGKDVTIVAVSHQVIESLAAAENLAKEGLSAEVIDLRSVKPLDQNTILKSLKKTGRLIVVDISHRSFGTASEVAAIAAESGFSYLKAPVARITLPEAPTPCSSVLEAAYYPGAREIADTARTLIRDGTYRPLLTPSHFGEATPQAVPFVGPF